MNFNKFKSIRHVLFSQTVFHFGRYYFESVRWSIMFKKFRQLSQPWRSDVVVAVVDGIIWNELFLCFQVTSNSCGTYSGSSTSYFQSPDKFQESCTHKINVRRNVCQIRWVWTRCGPFLREGKCLRFTQYGIVFSPILKNTHFYCESYRHGMDGSKCPNRLPLNTALRCTVSTWNIRTNYYGRLRRTQMKLLGLTVFPGSILRSSHSTNRPYRTTDRRTRANATSSRCSRTTTWRWTCPFCAAKIPVNTVKFRLLKSST